MQNKYPIRVRIIAMLMVMSTYYIFNILMQKISRKQVLLLSLFYR